ncbi:hypothetical protein OG716_03340 [Nocardia sp. NBC_01388]
MARASNALGSHVFGRTGDGAAFGERVIGQVRRRAEIGEQHLAGIGQQYIGGLDISMHHTRRVCGGESVQQGRRDSGGLVHREPAPLLDALLQRLPAHQAHDNPRHPVLDDNIVDRHDIRVIAQPRGGAGFMLGEGKAFGSFRIRGRGWQADFLDGHINTQQRVAGLPHPAEAADPQ